MSKVLLKYIPEAAMPLVASWFKEYQFHLKVAKSRRSKYGDFRPAINGKPHRISVNGDLNPYHFLITLTHEVAHVANWITNGRKVSPHGNEWKAIYSDLLQELMQAVEFPEDIQQALRQHLARPKASSCSDPQLFKVLKQYNPDSSLLFLEELEEGAHFSIHQKRIFKKGKKRRSRFECTELSSNRLYLISAHAEVEKLTIN